MKLAMISNDFCETWVDKDTYQELQKDKYSTKICVAYLRKYAA